MSQKKEHPDAEILRLLAAGREEAMDAIFRQYYGYLCKVIARILSQEHLAEDIAQEVFFELWKKRDVLEITTSLKAYLRRAGVNKALNYIRDRKIRWDDEEQLAFQKSPHAGISERLEGQELQALIDFSIDNLPERCRLVFTLSRFEEMSYREIAGHLNISIKTVENQMTKALRLLKEQLEPVLKNRG